MPDALTSYGLRTVDGSCNNLLPGREKFAAADVPFPRLDARPSSGTAEGVPAGFLGPGSPAIPSSSYAQKKGFVFDSQPRVISNLIADQTSTNPAAVAAAAVPACARQGNPAAATPCTTDPDPTASRPRRPGRLHARAQDAVHPERDHRRRPLAAVQLAVHLLRPVLRPRGRPDRQERRHRLHPAEGRRPARDARPRRQAGHGRRGPAGPALHGADPCAEPARARTAIARRTADDVQNANNTDTPWVDQSQTYSSHASHQVFLREYVLGTAGTSRRLRPASCSAASPPATYAGSPRHGRGRIDLGGGEAAGARQARPAAEGRRRVEHPDARDRPVRQVPPGPARGLPQYVTEDRPRRGQLAHPVPVPANVLHFDTPFLTDIAHNADPGTVGPGTSPGVPPAASAPDADNTPSHDFAHQPAGTYDDELLERALRLRRRSLQREHRAHRRSTRCSTPSTTGSSTTSRAFCSTTPRRPALRRCPTGSSRPRRTRRAGTASGCSRLPGS